MKSILLNVLALLCTTACASFPPLKLYSGAERPVRDVALYSLLNRADFNGPSIVTTHVDGRTWEQLSPGKSLPPTVALEPGEVSVRVSFNVYEDTVLWTLLKTATMKVKNFAGWYDLKFQAQAGKLYLPIFDYNLERAQRLSRMCIAELPQGASYAASRKPQRYVACATPSIPATEDNIRICHEIAAANPAVPAATYDEFCRKGDTQPIAGPRAGSR